MDSEKALPLYADDKNATRRGFAYQSQKIGSVQGKLHWSIKGIVLLGFVIGLLFVGHVLDDSLTTLWRKSRSHDEELPSDKTLERCVGAIPRNLDSPVCQFPWRYVCTIQLPRYSDCSLWSRGSTCAGWYRRESKSTFR